MLMIRANHGSFLEHLTNPLARPLQPFAKRLEQATHLVGIQRRGVVGTQQLPCQRQCIGDIHHLLNRRLDTFERLTEGIHLA